MVAVTMSQALDGSERFVEVSGRRLHVAFLGDHRVGAPIVFLHEGLGSVELWRNFPHAVVKATGRPAVVYSRYGNGRSDPLEQDREVDYMHVEALETLPQLLERVVESSPILVGHSDGASISLIYAGSGRQVAGLALIAPHVFVESLTVRSIASIRARFEDSGMLERMRRYHVDPKRTFLGWADIWLDPAFATWNIEEYLSGVACPVLLVQGDADEYGTEAQLDVIERKVTGPTRRGIVRGAGHSPHLSHPEQVLAEVAAFVEEIG